MAYTISVTPRNRLAHRIGPGVGLVYGSADITSYHQTLAEVTGITKFFRDTSNISVSGGVTDNGYLAVWSSSNKAFKAYAMTPTVKTGTIDDNDNAATLGHALYVVPLFESPRVPTLTAEASATGLIKDSDTASTDGVAVYVVVDDANFHPSYQLGHFEFVSPTNANGTGTIANGAETLTLYDNDSAATAGVVTRIVAASGGWEATTAASKDILVPTSSGKYIFVNHATTGSTPQVYFDEDATNTYDRLQATMVDNLDEPYKLYVGSLAATEESAVSAFPAGIQLAQIVTVGPKPFTYAIGSGGPEIYIQSRPDAASLPGAVVLKAQAAGAGLNAANASGQDVYVIASNGQAVKVAYAATPSGVQVYGYPEAASSDLTWLEVVADNADETFTTDSSIGFRGAPALTEVSNDVDVGAFPFHAIGVIA